MPFKVEVIVNNFLTYRDVAADAAKSLQSCPTLCNTMDGSPPGSPVPGILQARTLEWVAISSPKHQSEKWKWSCVQLLATPWTAAYKAPPSMGFSRQEYWSGMPLPSPMWINISILIVVVQWLSRVWLFVFPLTAAHQTSLSFSLLEFAQTHVHWVGDTIQPSHPLSSPSLALNLSQH